MAGITGLGTTYNLPNYTGLLYQIAPSDTPFLSAIGGLNGGGQSISTEFEWQTYDFNAPAQNVQVEGAAAPTAVERVRANVTNVTQIHQTKVSVSYSKQSAFGKHDGTNTEATNPIRSEVDWQTQQGLKQMVLDMEWSLLNGTYSKPGNNATARQTAGLTTVITSNRLLGPGVLQTAATSATDTITTGSVHSLVVGNKVVFRAVGAATNIVVGRAYYVTNVGSTTTFKVSIQPGGAALTLGTATGISFVSNTSLTAPTKAVFNQLAQNVYDAGGITDLNAATFIVPTSQKLNMSNAFTNQYLETSRTVGGINVSTVVTDFGTINVMLSRRIAQDTVVLASLDVCQPVFLEVPGKGHVFAEPLAKVGASDDVQLYGEIGLAYGPESAHGIYTGLAF
jgi:Family of unknown function (DUF5309)